MNTGLVFVFLSGFFCCGIVVGRFEIVLDRLKIVVGSLWGRCGLLWVVPGFSNCGGRNHVASGR